jgi:hypothetical protein
VPITIFPSIVPAKLSIANPTEYDYGISYLNRTGFTYLKDKIRVAWVQDFAKMGGAELSNKTLVDYGDQNGFQICGITPQKFDLGIIRAADIVIINNIFLFSSEQIKSMMMTIIDSCIPYVKYDHDIRETMRGEFSRGLLSRSALNVFVSPIHRECYEKAFGPDVTKRSITLPVAINDRPFYNQNIDRVKNSALSVYLPKQQHNLVEFIKNNIGKYKYMGLGNSKVHGLEIPRIKCVDNNEMTDIYNQFEYIIHLPDIQSAGDRVYFEALLCGCKVITNHNVGHLSWGFDENNHELIRTKLREAIVEFWVAVKRCLK